MPKPLTQKDKIKAFILKNPEVSNKDVATAFDSTAKAVGIYRWELRKAGKLEKLKNGWRRKVNGTSKEVTSPFALKQDEETIARKIKGFFKAKDVVTYEELSDHLDIGVSRTKKIIEKLVKEGHNYTIEDNHAIASIHIPKSGPVKLNVKKMSTGFFKFGAIGDNHMGSKYERQDVLEALYDEFERQGITVVYNTGNWIDGEARFNKHDLKVHGLGNQVKYFIDNYPKRKGITTYFIAGDDHEGWYVQREQIDIGRFAQQQAEQAGRTDLKYLGYMEADVVLKAKNGKTTIRVLHPGGGSSYAISYTVQKIIESYQGGEKPDVLLIGHYHKADYVFCRGVHAVQTGCTQDQSPFMRKKKLAAHLGGWIIELSTDDNGAVTRFKQEFMPFYDNGYYQKWIHKM